MSTIITSATTPSTTSTLSPFARGATLGGKRVEHWRVECPTSDARLVAPLRMRAAKHIIPCGDLFHEDVPDAWIDRVFAVMGRRPDHTFQVLTKRAERMRAYMTELRDSGEWMAWRWEDTGGYIWDASSARFADAFRNVWLGVSAERQQEADERIPELLATPAAVRFVSCEPLLGAMDLMRQSAHPAGDRLSVRSWLDGLDWVIVGGESGRGARPMHPDWARSIRDQCVAAGVPFFFKQVGEWSSFYDRDLADPDWRRCDQVEAASPSGQWLNLAGGQGFHGARVVRVQRVGKRAAGRLLDGREWSEMPESRQNPPIATERETP